MKRAGIGILVVLVALVALATVSWTSATTVRFTDAAGAPASDAYVHYHYHGDLMTQSTRSPTSRAARPPPGGRARTGGDSWSAACATATATFASTEAVHRPGRLRTEPPGVEATERGATAPGTAMGPVLRTDVAPTPDRTRLARGVPRGVPRVAPGRRCPAETDKAWSGRCTQPHSPTRPHVPYVLPAAPAVCHRERRGPGAADRADAQRPGCRV